jgi:hypothetical protein
LDGDRLLLYSGVHHNPFEIFVFDLVRDDHWRSERKVMRSGRGR